MKDFIDNEDDEEEFDGEEKQGETSSSCSKPIGAQQERRRRKRQEREALEELADLTGADLRDMIHKKAKKRPKIQQEVEAEAQMPCSVDAKKALSRITQQDQDTDPEDDIPLSARMAAAAKKTAEKMAKLPETVAVSAGLTF